MSNEAKALYNIVSACDKDGRTLRTDIVYKISDEERIKSAVERTSAMVAELYSKSYHEFRRAS